MLYRPGAELLLLAPNRNSPAAHVQVDTRCGVCPDRGGGGGRVAGNSSAPLLHALIWTSLYTVTLRGKYHRGSHPEVLLVKVQRQAQPPAHGFRVLVLVES